MMNTLVSYSVIIPHHNTPELLVRCVNSIPKRDDVEIIIVDDNSSPDVVNPNFFHSIEKENIRIILTTEGRGAGYARNIGVKNAQGLWLVFADADDYFTKHIKYIFDRYKNDDTYDAVFFNAMKVDELGETKEINLNTIVNNFLENKWFSEKVLRYEYWTPWSRMIKRKIVEDNNIVFEEVPIANDMMFVLNSTKNCKKITAEREYTYMYYCPSEGSQTSKKYSKDNLLFRLENRLRLRDFYKSVKYPFMFPIIRDHNLISKENKILLKQYNYCLIEDLWAVVKFIFAKTTHIF